MLRSFCFVGRERVRVWVFETDVGADALGLRLLILNSARGWKYKDRVSGEVEFCFLPLKNWS